MSAAASASNLPALVLAHLASARSVAGGGDRISQDDLAAARARAAGAGKDNFFDAINLAEAEELYALVRDLRPEHTLEIGFCSGVSALCILQALEHNGRGTHHVIDPYQSSYAAGAGLANVRAAGLEGRLDFHEAFPETVVPGLPTVQFAFIDASHLFDLSILDFVLADKRLEIGGVIGFHDLWMPALQDTVRCILANREYRVRNARLGYPVPLRARLRRGLAALCRRLPRARHIFRAEFLEPWESLGIDNLVFLEKTGGDVRDWQHHVRF